jgi:hypothetical protein
MKQIQVEWTVSQLQRVTGISRTTIEQRLARVKPIRETRRERLYPAPECFRAIIKAHRDDPSVHRLTTAKAQLAEFNLQQKRGEWLEKKSVEQVWTAQIIAAREVIMGSHLTKSEQDRVLNELADQQLIPILKKMGVETE